MVGMILVGLTAPAYNHLLDNITPLLLTLGLVLVVGSAVGLALLPSFFLGAVCGYLLPGAWPYLATVPGLAPLVGPPVTSTHGPASLRPWRWAEARCACGGPRRCAADRRW